MLRPVGGIDMRCQLVILFVLWTFASNHISLELFEIHRFMRCFCMMGQTLLEMLQWSFSHSQDNLAVVSCSLSPSINMSGRHHGRAAGRPWRGRPVASCSQCSHRMLQLPPLHSSAEQPELLSWLRSLRWGGIQLHTGHRLWGCAVHCGPWHRQEWLDDPGKCTRKK